MNYTGCIENETHYRRIQQIYSQKRQSNHLHEKDEILDSIKASKINDITVVGKGYVTTTSN